MLKKLRKTKGEVSILVLVLVGIGLMTWGAIEAERADKCEEDCQVEAVEE